MSAIAALIKDQDEAPKEDGGIKHRLALSAKIGMGREKIRSTIETELEQYEQFVTFAFRGADVDGDGSVDLAEMENALKALLLCLPCNMAEQRPLKERKGSNIVTRGMSAEEVELEQCAAAKAIEKNEGTPAACCVRAGKYLFVHYKAEDKDKVEGELKDSVMCRVESDGSVVEDTVGGTQIHPVDYPQSTPELKSAFVLFGELREAKAVEGRLLEMFSQADKAVEKDPHGVGADWTLLSHFITTNEFGEVSQEELMKITKIWLITKRYQEDLAQCWDEDDDLTSLEIANVLKLMRYMDAEDQGSSSMVGHVEAGRLMELVEEFAPSYQQRSLALCYCLAIWVIEGRAQPRHGMLRDKLEQRLKLESIFNLGCFRFTYLVLLFAVFASALTSSKKNEVSRGVQENILARYHLNHIEDITTLEDLKGYLFDFSEASGQLAPLSQSYWSKGAEYNLLSTNEVFLDSKPMPDIDFWIGRSFTFQAWVQLEDIITLPLEGLPIIQKTLEDGETCWSWRFPPSLAYGSHDYGRSVPHSVTGRHWEFAGAPYAAPYEESDHLVLHTVVVNTSWSSALNMYETSASFYVNDAQLVGTVALARPVTDCVSQKLLLGAKGLRLAAVNFFPRALTGSQVNETYASGTLLSDMGYGLRKKVSEPLLGVDALKQQLARNGETARIIGEVGQKVESANVLSSLAVVNRPEPAPQAVSRGTMNETDLATAADPTVAGAAATTVFGAPVYLDQTSQNYIAGDALPRLTATTGFAISAWLKFEQGNGGYLLGRALKAWSPANSDLRWQGLSDHCWFAYVGGDYTEFKFKSDTIPGWAPSLRVFDTQAPAGSEFSGKSWRHFFFQVDPTADPPLKICIDGICDGPQWALQTGSDRAGNPIDCEGSQYLQQQYPDAQRQAALDAAQYWVGERSPGGKGAWPYIGELMNFKVFDRALSAVEIASLFAEDPNPEPEAGGRPVRQTTGCVSADELEDDLLFRDEFGHDCYWYYETRLQGMSNCARSPTAQQRCQVACQSTELCWSVEASQPSMVIWPQQMEFRSNNRTWGSTCVARSTTVEAEAIRCGLNAQTPVDCSAHSGDRAALMECLGDTVWSASTGESNQFMPCAEIINTHVPSCTWDDTGLEDVAAAAQLSGEWSMLMWVEAVKVRRGTQCLQPQLRLVDGDGLTFSQLAGYDRTVQDFEDGCNTDAILAHVLYGSHAAGAPRLPSADITLAGDSRPSAGPGGKKHLLVFGRRVTAESAAAVALQLDSASNVDDANIVPNAAQAQGHQGPAPIKPNKDFLRIINVQGDVRLSPIRLSSVFPTKGEISSIHYQELQQQSKKAGPALPLEQQLTQHRMRDIKVFREKPFLVAPPLLIQSRRKSSECEWDFSNDVRQSIAEQGREQRCMEPYECPSYGADSVYQCPSKELDEDLFFGLTPEHFLESDRKAYVELLATITDHSIVVRPNKEGRTEIMYTDTFLDTLTDDVTVSSIFYAVEFGITTNLILHFHTNGGRVEAEYSLRHFVALTGSQLEEFIVWMLVVVLLILMMMTDTFISARAASRRFHEKQEASKKRQAGKDAELEKEQKPRVPVVSQILALMHSQNALGEEAHKIVMQVGFDMLIELAAIVFVIMIANDRANSGKETEELVGSILDMEWVSSAEENVAFKKTKFIDQMKELLNIIGYSERIETFGMVVTFAIFLRMIWATSAHPRIAHITATLQHCISEMLHFLLVFFLVLWGEAIIGTWKFGSRREDMKTVLTAMLAEFDAVIAPPGSLTVTDSDDWLYTCFVIVIHLVNFFFLMNFCLAIVLEGYTKMVTDIEVCTVEQDLVSDAWALLKINFLRLTRPIPPNGLIVLGLSKFNDHRYVTVDTLHSVFIEMDAKKTEQGCQQRMCGGLCRLWERMFGRESLRTSAEAFYAHYNNFEFLQESARDNSQAGSIEEVAKRVEAVHQKLVANNHKHMDLMRHIDDLGSLIKQVTTDQVLGTKTVRAETV